MMALLIIRVIIQLHKHIRLETLKSENEFMFDVSKMDYSSIS